MPCMFFDAFILLNESIWSNNQKLNQLYHPFAVGWFLQNILLGSFRDQENNPRIERSTIMEGGDTLAWSFIIEE